MLDELRQLPEQLPRYQQQIQRFFELVLDVDSAGREPQAQAARNYTYDMPKDPGLFCFRPIPLSFEPVEPGRCSPVLYSSGIRDMIDYSLRSCVERNITVRRCKNCGRWFPQTGRVSAEYCERPVPRGEQVCREIGAFKQWTKKQSDDPIFKAYGNVISSSNISGTRSFNTANTSSTSCPEKVGSFNMALRVSTFRLKRSFSSISFQKSASTKE